MAAVVKKRSCKITTRVRSISTRALGHVKAVLLGASGREVVFHWEADQ